MKNRYSLLLLLLICVCILLSSFPANASKVELENLQKKLDLLESERDLLNKKYKDNLKNQSKLEQEIYALENDINAIQENIDQTESQINATQEDLLNIEAKLMLAVRDVNQHDAALKQRLRTMYKFKKHGFLEVLMRSENISDLLTRLDRIQLILESDKKLLVELNKAKSQVETAKNELEKKKHDLEVFKATMQRQRAELVANRDVVTKKKRELALDADLALKNINKLNEDAEALTKIIAAMEINMDFVGGPFGWPLDLKYRNITSQFGFRIHPIYQVPSGHSGTDIGAPTGAKIYAAQSGVVLLAARNGGYGNCVIIDHGGGIVSVYGHASEIKCRKGQAVRKGDVVALVGSTGVSTGPHLHFEIRVKGQPVDAMGYYRK